MKILPTPYKSDRTPSIHEQFLMDFFESKGCKYHYEKWKFNNLNGDNKSSRVPDFYLPQYNVFVEYCGHYNHSKERRNEYILKADVYIKNRIPTIFLYPDELGIIEHIFHKRMIKLMNIESLNLKKSLIKYKLNRFLDKTLRGNSLLFFCCIFILFSIIYYGYDIKSDLIIVISSVTLVFLLFSFIYIFIDFWRYFIKEK